MVLWVNNLFVFLVLTIYFVPVQAQKLFRQEFDEGGIYPEIGANSFRDLERTWEEIKTKKFKNHASQNARENQLYQSGIVLKSKTKPYLSPSIRAFDGTIFKRHDLGFDDFRMGLMHKLKYEAYSNKIFESYSKRIVPIVNALKNVENHFRTREDLLRYIQSWIWTNAYVLGSIKVSPFENLNNDALLGSQLKTSPELKKAFKDFFNDLTVFIGKDIGPQKHQNKIVIITSTGAGGGHYSTALAIEEFVKDRFKSHDVVVINTRELLAEDDPLFRITGKMHSEDIFNQIVQEEHDLAKGHLYWSVLADLRSYVRDNSLRDLTKRVAAENPDIIISCLHHRVEYIAISYLLNVPQLIVTTDYALQENLYPFIQIGSPKLLKILAATKSPTFFKKFHRALVVSQSMSSSADFYSPKIRSAIDFYVHRQMDWHGLESALPIFGNMSIPIKNSFVFDRSEENLSRIREIYGLRQDQKVVAVSMGAQGTGALEKIADNLIKTQAFWKPNLVFFLLCGKNEKMRTHLKDRISRSHLDNIEMRVLGALDASRMADMYNLADLLISKPGGLTTREVAATWTPMLAYEYYLWEKPNIDYLASIGLGHKLNKFGQLLETAQKLLEIGRPLPAQPVPATVWQQQLIHELRSFNLRNKR